MDATINSPDNEPTQTLHAVNPDMLSRLGFIAGLRLRRAERVKATMEHKDALYEELGMAAIDGKRTVPEDNRPRTVGEQFMDYRLQRKSDKKALADVYAYRAKQIHGPDTAVPVSSVRHGLTEAVLGVVTDREPEHGLKDVAVENTKRVFEGPHIPGYTPLKRKVEKAKVAKHIVTRESTSAENRQRLTEINAEKTKLGNKMHKRTRRKQRKHDERVRLAAEQPLLQRHRERRLRRAERVIEKYHGGSPSPLWLQKIQQVRDDIKGSATALGQEIAEQHQESWDLTKRQVERLAAVSLKVGQLATRETVATTQTAIKGGRYTADFYAEVARGAADIYWQAGKHAAKKVTRRSNMTTTEDESGQRAQEKSQEEPLEFPRDPRFTEELVSALKGAASLAGSGQDVKITGYRGTEKVGDNVKHYIEYEDADGNKNFTTLDQLLWSHLPAERQEEIKQAGLDPYALDGLFDPIFKPPEDQ